MVGERYPVKRGCEGTFLGTGLLHNRDSRSWLLAGWDQQCLAPLTYLDASSSKSKYVRTNITGTFYILLPVASYNQYQMLSMKSIPEKVSSSRPSGQADGQRGLDYNVFNDRDHSCGEHATLIVNKAL